MKKTFLALGLLGATSALAMMPTEIMCTGNGTSMMIEMTEQQNDDGMMEMMASMSMNETTYSMGQVMVTPTPMGMMYTVRTDYVPDLRQSFMTFVMPTINVVPGRGSVEFMGVLYNHAKKTTFAGPRMIHGAIDTIGSGTMMDCSAMGMGEMPE